MAPLGNEHGDTTSAKPIVNLSGTRRSKWTSKTSLPKRFLHSRDVPAPSNVVGPGSDWTRPCGSGAAAECFSCPRTRHGTNLCSVGQRHRSYNPLLRGIHGKSKGTGASFGRGDYRV